MARSLATWHPAPIVAAAAAWVAAGAVVLAIPAATPRAVAIPAVAAHRSATAHWTGADRVYAEVDRRARRVGPEQRTRIARAILEESARTGLAPFLVLAVIETESGYDVGAVSPAGAVGLMQLMLPTLREVLEVRAVADPFEPVANVRAGVRYLGQLVQKFADVELALMAYNAGPNRIRRHLEDGGIPSRFLGYPRDVLRRLARLAPPLQAVTPRGRSAPAATACAAHRARPSARWPGSAVALGCGTLAAPYAVALGSGTLAAPSAVALVAGTPGSPSDDACVRHEPALPISRGRDRPRPVERTLRG